VIDARAVDQDVGSSQIVGGAQLRQLRGVGKVVRRGTRLDTQVGQVRHCRVEVFLATGDHMHAGARAPQGLRAAAPMPDEPPVTTACLPRRENSSSR
jgi:hypothetical protein